MVSSIPMFNHDDLCYGHNNMVYKTLYSFRVEVSKIKNCYKFLPIMRYGRKVGETKEVITLLLLSLVILRNKPVEMKFLRGLNIIPKKIELLGLRKM